MTLTQANGLRTVSVYDKAGQKISQYEQSPEGQNLGETRYVYDVLGRLRITTDPAGRQTFIVYDEAGRKTGDVDVNGILTEYQ
ncbi:RHS repeat protein, partial [Achromobacter sp. Marseille-Q0513]